jgi:acyl-CoA reductase-like NAD-dependent aldehyde dehydrogenase
MKPSPETSATSVALAILAQRAGVPDGVVNVVTGSTADTPAIGKLLCEDKRIKKLHFTGSTPVSDLEGWRWKARMAEVRSASCWLASALPV